jgi:probable HAF family extracellular repeat protein
LGGTQTHAIAVNSSGQVAGNSRTSESGPYHAFRHDGGSNGPIHDLGTLGGTDSFALDMNSAALIVGLSQMPGDLVHHAFMYVGTPGSGGTMIDLGTLAGGSFSSQASEINASGQIAGWSNTTAGAPHAFRYDGVPGAGGVMRDLGTLGGIHSYGFAINDSGQVAGRSYISGGDSTTEHAFRYDGDPGLGGMMRDLGTLGGSSSAAHGINAGGQVVGISQTLNNVAFHAFRYDGTPGEDGVMHDLGTLGGPASRAESINDFGIIVGSADRSGAEGGEQVAALWMADRMIMDLDAWLDLVNPSQGARWTLRTATDITSSGIITGVATYSDGPGNLIDGAFISYRLDASSLVPEPSAGLLPVVWLVLVRSRMKSHRDRHW